ncbi:MAG: DUF721 domain-containing protein [Anaerosomatales bacterium]|nr:DUF721 domain-containing protein [Anaerosomatales bacterium]
MIRVGDAMKSVIRGSDRRGGLLKARAAEVWEEVVGPDIAGHTVGMGVRAGELNVHVDSHAWATQLTLMSEELRDRINTALGESSVRSVRFTVSSAVSEARAQKNTEVQARRRYGGEVVEPVPLSDEETREIVEAAGEIDSDSVREAAIRARIRDKELKKGREMRSSTLGPSEGPRGAKTDGLP